MKKHEADLTSYRNTYLECRLGMSGHSWRWQHDFKILRNSRGVITEFSRLRRCTRCKTQSVKVYDGKTGTLLRRTYTYPDGYMIDTTHFKMMPGMAALEALNRAMASGHAEEDS